MANEKDLGKEVKKLRDEVDDTIDKVKELCAVVFDDGEHHYSMRHTFSGESKRNSDIYSDGKEFVYN